MKTPSTVTYSLTSTEWVDAPSLFQFCREGYLSAARKAHREKYIEVIKAWQLPVEAIVKLLSGEVTPTITEDRKVTFSI